MTIYIGDSLEWLKRLPSDSVHCVVTSPPYYGLRAYLANDNPMKEYEIGLEETPEMFIEKLVTLFREVRRVLRRDGTCWVNMGDSYWANRSENGNVWADGNLSKDYQARAGGKPNDTYKPKDLMMIPARLAIALQSDGWWLRSDIIWHKPNPMPESVTDRPTKSHEHIFLLTKNATYWYDADAVREPNTQYTIDRLKYPKQSFGEHAKTQALREAGLRHDSGSYDTAIGRNKRDVWTIATQPFSEAHFATFPQELAETCIKAGCPETVCAVCGAGYVPVVEKSGGTIGKGWTDHTADLGKGMSQVSHSGGVGNARNDNGKSYTRELRGYAPSCTCNGATCNGMVLDPFGGAGTTALAAIHLNRQYQLIELNIKYVGIAQKRIAAFNPYQATPLDNGMKQRSLFEGIA